MKVKFAHISDVHLGAWRNENLNEIGYQAFEVAIDKIIKEQIDFVIISGDLYDVSSPKVDVVDLATRQLKKLSVNKIPLYAIMGSHDFSPSNKSMIRPLISAELFNDVSKGERTEQEKLRLNFTQDPKTKIKITGLRARKRGLEVEDYQALDRESLESEEGPKIFILHTVLNELKPIEFKDIESAPKSLLPGGFIYYAGGHLHKTVPEKLREGENKLDLSEKNNIVYPGCLFPTDFRELEQFQYGGFCIISGEISEGAQKASLRAEWIPVKIKDIITLYIDCNNKTVPQALEIINTEISQNQFEDKIVSIRIYGELSSGKAYEIKNNDIVQKLKDKGAYEVLLNKSALSSKEYKPINIDVGKTNEEIENTLVHEHAQRVKIKNLSKSDLEKNVHEFLEVLGKEREEETRVKDYNENLVQEFRKIFKLEEEVKDLR